MRPWLHRALLAISITIFGASTAQADLFVPRDGRVVGVERRVLVIHDAGAETIAEELEVTSTARTFVWFRAFPVEPVVGPNPDPKLFDVLAEETMVHKPYNQRIRDNLFGPSVVTILSRRIQDPPPSPPVHTPPSRSLSFSEVRYFTGRVTTSSITRELILPEELAEYLRRRDIEPSPDDANEIARCLNRSWVLAARVVQDTAPSEDQTALLGPFRFDFPAVRAIYPQMGIDRPFFRHPDADFYIMGDKPLVPTSLRTIWDARPWERPPKRRGEFIATYAQPLEPDAQVLLEVEDRLGISVQAPPFFIRARYDRGREPLADLELSRPQKTAIIPGSGHRKSATDIFLCILLGLTPLIYTPESWFLLWVVARAKEKVRKEGQGIGTKLWSLYAIVVALFWFITMEDVGRLAALAPLVIGVVQLALPYTERDAPPVRVQFKKKKA